MSTERVHRHRFVWSGLASLSMVAITGAAGASVTNNWINWNAPTGSATSGVTGDYTQTATWFPTSGPGESYTYASGATGAITMPDTSTVNVTMSGEVVNPYAFNWAGPSSIYGGPSGFDSNGTSSNTFWGTRPATDAATYSSANVSSAPNNGDHIGLIGSGLATTTITFDQTVSNIVMVIYSLGSSGEQGEWTFDQDFVVLSDNDGASSGGVTGSGLTRTVSGGQYKLSGNEGAGIIQFTGSFTSFSWTVTNPERWAVWNIGVTSAIAPSAVPGTGLTAIGTLGLAGLAGRRRR